MPSFLNHETRGLFLVPSPLCLVEHHNSLFRRRCRLDVFIAKMVDVLGKCAGVTICILLTYRFGLGLTAVRLIDCESFTQHRDQWSIARQKYSVLLLGSPHPFSCNV